MEWLKPKGPEHTVSEYYIYLWLGRNAFAKHRELFDRVQSCSNDLGALAIVCRSYATHRDEIETFWQEYRGGAQIPIERWNANYHRMEATAVDIESFHWFANRLLTRVALTLNYFFRKMRREKRSAGSAIKSHATLLTSDIWRFLPPSIQNAAVRLKTEVTDFRNESVEHDLKYWRERKLQFANSLNGGDGHITIGFPPGGEKHPRKPLREIWIEIHDYLTEVAKFLGSQSQTLA